MVEGNVEVAIECATNAMDPGSKRSSPRITSEIDVTPLTSDRTTGEIAKSHDECPSPTREALRGREGDLRRGFWNFHALSSTAVITRLALVCTLAFEPDPAPHMTLAVGFVALDFLLLSRRQQPNFDRIMGTP
jgi:hypothetical protein